MRPDDFFTDFEEMREEIEDAFMDIDDQGPRELMGDYETLKDVGVFIICIWIFHDNRIR